MPYGCKTKRQIGNHLPTALYFIHKIHIKLPNTGIVSGNNTNKPIDNFAEVIREEIYY